jgi:hypothetical protein
MTSAGSRASSPTSWPGLTRPPRPGEVLCFADRDHRHETGDDGKSGARCNVLTLFLTLCIIRARPCSSRPDGGRAREASQEWGGERSCSRPRTPVGGRPLAALCWSKSKRLKVPRARRRPALPIPPSTSSRAARRTTLDHPHGSGLPSPGPTGAGSVTHIIHPQTSSHPPRHGRACPGHPGTEKRCASPNRDHRHKPGDDGGECQGRRAQAEAGAGKPARHRHPGEARNP